MNNYAIQRRYHRPACFSCDTRKEMTFVWLEGNTDTFLVPQPPPPVLNRVLGVAFAMDGQPQALVTTAFELREVREGNIRRLFYEEMLS